MRCTIILLLFWAAATLEGASIRSDFRWASALENETIPNLELNGATCAQAFGVIRKDWNRRHPKKPFPVLFTDLVAANGFPSLTEYQSPARLTLHLRNVPYVDAIRYAASCFDRKIAVRGRVLRLLDQRGYLDDWSEESYDLSPTALDRLKLQKDSPARAVRRALQRVGLLARDWEIFDLQKSGDQLHAVCTQPEHEKINALLALFDAGYRVSK